MKARRKQVFIEDLKTGDVVNEMFMIAGKIDENTLILSDRSGRIKLIIPEEDNNLIKNLDVGEVILINDGVVMGNTEEKYILLEEQSNVKKLDKSEVSVEDFVPSLTEEEMKKMMAEIKNYIGSVKNQYIRKLLEKIFEDKELITRFSKIPSSLNHHHNYLGGNLEHTLNVVRICDALSKINDKLDRDLMIAGALLHDIGKALEYQPSYVIDKTDEGILSGHIVLGYKIIKEKIEELRSEGVDFPEELEMKLSHMVLSHHGKHEWGSPQIPRFVEALALHYADYVDAHLKYHLQKVEEERKSGKTKWGFIWDNDMKKRKRFMLEG